MSRAAATTLAMLASIGPRAAVPGLGPWTLNRAQRRERRRRLRRRGKGYTRSPNVPRTGGIHATAWGRR